MNVWLLMANIVATMNIEKSADEVGELITPNPEYVGSYVRYACLPLASGTSVIFYSPMITISPDMRNRLRAK